MEKQKRWQLLLIVTVLVLTVYNILPTIFYYSKPLRSPVDASRASTVATQIIHRVNDLETDAVEWTKAYIRHLRLEAKSVALDESDPRLIHVNFRTERDANYFKRFFDQAAARVPFVPAQLSIASQGMWGEPTAVTIERRVGVHLDPQNKDELFTFTEKFLEDQPTPLYESLIADRVASLATALGGPSRQGLQAQYLASTNAQDPATAETLLSLAKEMVDIHETFGGDHALTKRYFASFGVVDNPASPANLAARFEKAASQLATRKGALVQEQKKVQDAGGFLDPAQEQLLSVLENQERVLKQATQITRNSSSLFSVAESPLTRGQALQALKATSAAPISEYQMISLGNRHYLFTALAVDWPNDRAIITLHPDILDLRNRQTSSEWEQFKKERLNQLIINEVARVSRVTEETLSPRVDDLVVDLKQLSDSQSVLVFNLGVLAKQISHTVQNHLQEGWHPQHPDLARDVYPILDFEAYQQRPAQDRQFGLVVYNPTAKQTEPEKGFRSGSLYVIGKGIQTVLQKYLDFPDDPENQKLAQDLNNLQNLMKDRGFIAYKPASFGMAPAYSQDIIFEMPDFYTNVLKATREDFQVKGDKRFAVLEFGDVEQRILTINRIEQEIHEDILKWREEYETAQVDLNPMSKYLVPPPVKSAYWENLKINWRKYFRGDDRKILRWGLDLSGGKSVRIGLRDPNNRPVTDPADLKQAVNELYTRINKMGVSERSIRIENQNIVLDFPGVQGLSASELVKASAMHFHIVNEKFSPVNATLADSVNQFLQEVWNEAVVTNRQDVESLNEIAWQHLGGDTESGIALRPRSEHAKILYENGLRFANPKDKTVSNAFNDSLSAIAVWRGEDYAEWQGQAHPLLVIFRNYALEGSSLEGIQAGYDPSKGNILTFSVTGSYAGDRRGDPREDFYAWTSQFSEEKILGTPREAYSRGRGWRMAVILNNQVVSAPALSAPLKDNAMIHGSFSQREVNRLAADLKAGSLSFTPKILSETNVSPELGKEERVRGISAAVVGLCFVVVAMVAYYRFSGLVASFAVLCNLLIIWGVLQNLDAALTLPGIAGIILTVGMAVDANVLVFERIREEFKVSGKIASAVQAGYKKAFSAILDSNITTIMAALILIQFDSGPIKGFAVTIIIGVASSMFTALFMTRYFFAGWVRNPKNTKLTMTDLVGETKFDFLSKARVAVIASLLFMVVGTGALVSQWNTLLGMDFTGGYAVALELDEQEGLLSYRTATLDALLEKGAFPGDVQVRELNKPNQLRIQLGRSMEEEGHPYSGMPYTMDVENPTFDFETNPRLAWVVNALQDNGLFIRKTQLQDLDKGWNQMSGQFSDVMRNNALMALGLAMMSILIYLTFRFEFKYAISALIALTHDVLISMGLVGILVYLGVPMQIDLQVIGAIMLIIGYSLNDTIIVFDRIREDVRLHRKWSFHDVVNHALNVTLARTLMTSGTTLLVLLSLVCFGGSSIFDLALVMTIGVAFGTLSSLFIAAPVMLFFHRRELTQQDGTMALKKA